VDYLRKDLNSLENLKENLKINEETFISEDNNKLNIESK